VLEHPAVVPEKRPVLASPVQSHVDRACRSGHPAERLKQRDHGAPAWGGAWTPPTAGAHTAWSEADADAAPAGANLKSIGCSRRTAASRRQPIQTWAPSRRHTACAESALSAPPQKQRRQASTARTEPAPGGRLSLSPGAVPVRKHPVVVPEKRRFWHLRFRPKQTAFVGWGTEPPPAVRLRRPSRATPVPGTSGREAKEEVGSGIGSGSARVNPRLPKGAPNRGQATA